MAGWIRLSEAASRFKIPLESLCNLVGLKSIPEQQVDSYWLLLEVSHKIGPRKEPKELKTATICTRILHIVCSEDIYPEDDPDELLYIFSSLKKATPLFSQIILECYLSLPPGQKREIFRRLSQGEDIYALARETGLTQQQIYKRYEAAVNELVEKQQEVIDNLKMKLELVEEINRQALINRRLVSTIEKREGKRRNFYANYTSGGLIPTEEDLKKLSMTFIDLGIDYAIRRKLADNGIETLSELLKVFKLSGPYSLLRFKNFGKKSLNILKNKLMEAGLVDENFDSEYFEYINSF